METRILSKLTGKKPSKKTRKSGTKIAAAVLSTFLFSQPSICPIALAQSVPLPPANAADLPTSASAGDTVVNQGQTHVLDFSNSSSISIANNLMNMGTIYALSTNPAITSGSVNANSIFNFPGAIITSVLPSGGLPGYSNAVGGFSFTLNAINNIVNSGTIASAGDLNLVAGGAIVNALPSGVAGPSPVMQAMQNVNIISANILNSGAITSALANINVSTVLSQNILINNQLGVLQALNGSLNIRDSVFFEKFNTTIFGGDILAKELNIFSGKGITDISVFNLTPRVNLDTGEAYVKANSNISIGTVAFNGDPTFTSGGDVFLEGDQDGNGPLTVEATGDIINKSAVNVTGTGPIRYHAGGSIQLDGLLNISTNDKVELLADFGSVSAPGTKIEAGLRVAGLAPGPVPGTKLPSSVFVFAHNSIDVGDIKSPDGSILLRAGGDLVGDTYFAGSNQGTLNAGTIDISGERVSGPGQIWIDNFGGDVTLGSLIGDGGRILVQSAGQIQVTGKSDTPAILNNALAARTSGFFTADTILQGNQITINGGSIKSSGGSLQMQSNGNVQFSNVAKVTADDLFSNGAFVRIIGSDSVVFDQSPIFSLQNTSPIPTELQIFSDFGVLSFGSPLTISANATQPDAPGGNVSLGGAAVNFAGKVNINANGQGSGSGGGINIAAGNALSFSKNDIQLVARGGTEGGSGGFVGVAGSGLQIDARSIDVDAGTNGNGGWIRLDGSNMFEAGTQLIVTGGSLQADGNGTGNGGTVQLINGQSAFVLGGKGANATGINVRSGLEGGNGGTVLAQSGGDLTINTANVNTEARGENGSGGNIRLRAGISGGDFGFVREHNGALTINGGINVSGKGVGDGGTIHAETYSIGAEDGGGGGGGVGTAAITLSAAAAQGSIQVNNALTANAGAIGNGGSIRLEARANRSASGKVPELPASVLVGTLEAAANLRAEGGTSAGSGGTININSNGSVVLNSNVVSTNARGDGNGGTIEVNIDAPPTPDDGSGGGIGASSIVMMAAFTAEGEETALLNAGLRANGAGTGSGGTIALKALEGKVTIHSPSTVSLSANSGNEGGLGGSLNIQAQSISITGSVLAKGDQGNGHVVVNARQNVQVSGDTIDTSSLNGARGGTIEITTIEGDINIASDLRSLGGDNGDGGEITIQAGSNIEISDSRVTVNSKLGNAGSVTIKSGLFQDAHTHITGDVSADGSTKGGTINIEASSGTLNVSGEFISAKNAGEGDAGSIKLESRDQLSTTTTLITVNATGIGKAGTVILNSQQGNVNTKTTILASQTGTKGDGGHISITAPNGGTHIDGPLHADAKGEGNGGQIFIDGPNGNITLYEVTARGLFGGQFINLNPNGGTIDMAGIDVSGPLAGGIVALEASGNIRVVGDIKAGSTTPAGSAGLILINANTSGSGTDPFIIGEISKNGVYGVIDASGHGRQRVNLTQISALTAVHIRDSGQGGMRVHGANVRTAITNPALGQPSIGHATLLSTPGTLRIEGTLSVSTNNCCANSLVLIASKIEFGQDAQVMANSNTGFAGSIFMSASEIFSEGSLLISATGNHPNRAQMPTGNSIEPNSGQIRILPSMNIDENIEFGVRLDPVGGRFLDFAKFPVSINDKGGTVQFTGGGDVVIDASGKTQAGYVTISGQELTFSGATTIKANSSSGHAGQIVIGKEASIQIGSNSTLSLLANGSGKSNGAGGFIDINGQKSDLTVGQGSGMIAISANGGNIPNSAAANQVTIHAQELTVSGEALSFNSNKNSGSLLVLNASESLTLKNGIDLRGSNKTQNARGGSLTATGSRIVMDGAVIDTSGPSSSSNWGKVSLTANSGSITNTVDSEIRAMEVDLRAIEGNVGEATRAIELGANIVNVSAKASIPQPPLITGASYIRLNSFGSIQNTQVEAEATGENVIHAENVNLSLRKVSAHGDINIDVRNGSVSVSGGAATTDPFLNPNVFANHGAVRIQTSHNIFLDNGALITANGGNVILLAGGETSSENHTVLLAATQDPFLTVNLLGSGLVRFAENPTVVTWTNGGNVLTADNATISLNSIPGTGSIQLAGNVHINAFGVARPISFASGPVLAANSCFTTPKLDIVPDEFFEGSLEVSGPTITRGSCVVNAQQSCKIKMPGGSIALDRGATVLVEMVGDLNLIKNLSVKTINIILDRGESVKLHAGQELIFGGTLRKEIDAIARRRVTNFQNGTIISEYSPITLLATNSILKTLRKTQRTREKEIYASILKQAAAISSITAHHGSFTSR